MVLRNTYINALLLSSFMPPEAETKPQKPSAIKWADATRPEEKNAIATVISDKPIETITVHKAIPKASLKPIIIKEAEDLFLNPFSIPKESVEILDTDMFAIPIVERNKKRKEVDNKIYMKQGKSPFKKARRETAKRLENEKKYGSDTLKKIQPDFFPDMWRPNIIIQNPQKVEFNTFISRDVVDKKAAKVLVT
eukprot:TRINITY_DN2094_c0_g3_i1.p2 TRINITY_DN2094_c0_g3~~TRINITY_DN2094_c0_g3_i1.p2  ORF type:complete len:194 (-),score=54.46 TRINITY_DN2094_c0_g3_i1:533-1114(-)